MQRSEAFRPIPGPHWPRPFMRQDYISKSIKIFDEFSRTLTLKGRIESLDPNTSLGREQEAFKGSIEKIFVDSKSMEQRLSDMGYRFNEPGQFAEYGLPIAVLGIGILAYAKILKSGNFVLKRLGTYFGSDEQELGGK